jgi:transposase
VWGSLRERSDKPSTGQAGLKGDTLRKVAEPDRIVRHEVRARSHCRAALTASMEKGVEARQVFDLPGRLIEVTEHQASIYCCAACRWMTKAAFPEGVASAVQYGPRVRAAAIYLSIQQLIPEDRVAQTMRDLFGAERFCPDSLCGWVEKNAQAFKTVYAQPSWRRPCRIAARLEAQ